jgi:hypothetical protein
MSSKMQNINITTSKITILVEYIETLLIAGQSEWNEPKQ